MLGSIHVEKLGFLSAAKSRRNHVLGNIHSKRIDALAMFSSDFLGHQLAIARQEPVNKEFRCIEDEGPC